MRDSHFPLVMFMNFIVQYDYVYAFDITVEMFLHI